MSEDPNKDRNDPMVPEYWTLGEDLMEQMRSSGATIEGLEGVAVDIHDILQIADSIKSILASDAILEEKLQALRFEADHMKWHAESLKSAVGN
jgi:hypothetical protein